MIVEARVILSGQYADLFLNITEGYNVNGDVFATDIITAYLDKKLNSRIAEMEPETVLDEQKKNSIKAAVQRRSKQPEPQPKRLMGFKEFVNQQKEEPAK
jgi:methylase of polypeptide subunit release factors